MEDLGVDVLVLEAHKAKKGNDVTAYGTKRAEEFWTHMKIWNGNIPVS